MAACTSRAAPSILRFRSNCSVMLVVPKLLDEVISLTPAIRPNWRSSGVATEDAMISGLAPGKLAPTEIVGKSICGNGDTGNERNATAPASAIAAVSNAVATGRWMNGVDRLMASIRRNGLRTSVSRALGAKSLRQLVKENVDHRRGIERQHLA